MNNREEILARIKLSMNVLEKENPDEFDLITALFSIFYETASLMRVTCGRGKIEGWKDKDAPEFYRVVSQLKKGLEQQQDYLNSVSEQLITDGDDVSNKILAVQEKISSLLKNSLLKQEQTVLMEAEALFAKHAELQEKKIRVEKLLNRKNELDDLIKEYGDIDLKVLQAEIEKKKIELNNLESICTPLLKKQAELQKSIAELKAVEQGFDTELDMLENACDEESLRITGKIPAWIERIKIQRSKRGPKVGQYKAKLEKAAAELAETEKEIKQQLDSINEALSAKEDAREILTKHFEENRKISEKFSSSLDTVQSDLSDLADSIAKDLDHFDALLRKAQQRIQEFAATHKPIGIGG